MILPEIRRPIYPANPIKPALPPRVADPSDSIGGRRPGVVLPHPRRWETTPPTVGHYAITWRGEPQVTTVGHASEPLVALVERRGYNRSRATLRTLPHSTSTWEGTTMKDLVLDGFVDDFTEARGLSGLPPHGVFEAFSTSSLLRKYHQTDIGDGTDVLVGGTHDGGVDAIAILVNGHLVGSAEDLNSFFNKHGRLDVEIIFVQAKLSPKFNAGEIGTFIFGVEQFFNALITGTTSIRFNSEVSSKIALIRTIYTQSIKMHRNPKCFLYYVTTGRWTDACELKARLADGKARLEHMNLFSDVAILPVDQNLLKDIYRELERSVVKEVEFTRTASFPLIDRVGEAYIGLLPGDQFIALVSTDEGDLNRDLFFDNVRDFQGHNPVNREIEHTLQDDTRRNSFPLLNNGVTIIAGSIRRRADTFQIHDFQIVNGCQTTHILFQNRRVIGPDMYVPIKLVATDDGQVVNEVIKATNRQTAVLPEALESLSTFHRELEDFYNAQERKYDPSDRLYYERRSKQYALDNIHTRNIVTLTAQIKSFIGMFLNQPHSHPRYYGELLRAYEGRIFASDHLPDPYYTSGVALTLVEGWINAHPDWRELRFYKYQILMLLRNQIAGLSLPRLNSKLIAPYSLRIADTMRDPVDGHEQFNKAVVTLRYSLDSFRPSQADRLSRPGSNPPHRLRAFTEHLSRSLETEKGPQADDSTVPFSVVGRRERGQLTFFDDVRGYGFIRSVTGEDRFVHVSEMAEVPYHLRVKEVEMVYTVAVSPRHPDQLVASRVELVPMESLTQ